MSQPIASNVVDLAAYQAARPPASPADGRPIGRPTAPRILTERQLAHRRAMLEALGRARPTRALS
jgi:hypothetical protein